MSLLALLAAAAPTGTPVTPTGPTWTDDSTSGGGTWTTPTETGVTYSPATGTATPGQTVTVTATAQDGYYIVGTATWTHTFPTAAVPYAFPTSAPYNVPVRMVTPTPDGTGQAVHPSVVDFQTQHGQATWNGHRYWLAITPYANGNSGVENPCILASDDGYTWIVPAGLTNPIDPPPGATGYNSDTDMEYDPDTGRLWCFWREHNHSDTTRPLGELLHCAWSTDGVTWTKVEQVLTDGSGDGQSGKFLSPGIVRHGPGDWRMVSIGRLAISTPRYWTSTAPTGPWTEVGPVTFTWTGMTAQEVWHFGMTRSGGVYRALLDINGPSTQAVFAASSLDGQTWNVNGAEPVIDEVPGAWDMRPYRACLAPHEDGVKARVWYSASNSVSTPYEWNTGYTQVPLTEWPAPPA